MKILKVEVNLKKLWRRSRCAQGRCATRLRYAPTLRDSESISWLSREDSENMESAHAYPIEPPIPTLSIVALSASFVSERRLAPAMYGSNALNEHL